MQQHYDFDAIVIGSGPGGEGAAMGPQRFQFDVNSDCLQFYGNNDSDDLVLDRSGSSIPFTGVGQYKIRVNEQTLAYSLTKL